MKILQHYSLIIRLNVAQRISFETLYYMHISYSFRPFGLPMIHPAQSLTLTSHDLALILIWQSSGFNS